MIKLTTAVGIPSIPPESMNKLEGDSWNEEYNTPRLEVYQSG